MSRKSRLENGLKRVGQDLTAIAAILGTLNVRLGPKTPDQTYLVRQAGKYLQPLTNEAAFNLPIMQGDIKKLKAFFCDGTVAERLTHWYTGEGAEPAPTGTRTHRLKLWLAFGWSPVLGGAEQQIVMQGKAWMLTDKVFAGVMLHEATHFVLGTKDIKYDTVYKVGHADLKALDEDDRYKNADNWRIFYEKMSVYLRREKADPEDAVA